MSCKTHRTLDIYTPEYRAAVVERLQSKLTVEDGHWLFQGAGDGNGYGKLALINFNGQTTARAHVVAYLLHKGDIPPLLDVGHRCNVKRCCNPDHLYLATRSENVQHAVRDRLTRHHGHSGARLADAQVREIRAQYAAGGVTQRELAKTYGVDQQIVSRITRKQAFQWVDSRASAH